MFARTCVCDLGPSICNDRSLELCALPLIVGLFKGSFLGSTTPQNESVPGYKSLKMHKTCPNLMESCPIHNPQNILSGCVSAPDQPNCVF